MHATSTQASTTTGRNARGQFTKGNAGGPGNPFARQVAQLRSILVNAVTPDKMHQIAEDLVCKAMLGNMDAIKLLFLYIIGKPTAPVNPDRLDIEEWMLEKERTVPLEEIREVEETPPSNRAVDSVPLQREVTLNTVATEIAAAGDEPSAQEPSCHRSRTPSASTSVDHGRKGDRTAQSASTEEERTRRLVERMLSAFSNSGRERPSAPPTPSQEVSERRADSKRT